MTNFRQYVLSLPAQLSHNEPLFPGWEFSLSPHLIRSTKVRYNLPSECNSLVLVHLGNWFGRNWEISCFIVTNATNAAPSSLKSKNPAQANEISETQYLNLSTFFFLPSSNLTSDFSSRFLPTDDTVTGPFFTLNLNQTLFLIKQLFC